MHFQLIIFFAFFLLMANANRNQSEFSKLLKRPIVIAHRGASGYLPEHTLESKVAAIVMKSDYIEQDVVLTRDNIPIVLHDIYLDEVTNVADMFPNRNRTRNNHSRYYAIDFDLNEIKQLQVTERFNHLKRSEQVYPNRFPLFRSSFQISTLEEEIQLIQGLEKSLNLFNLDSNSEPIEIGVYVELKRPDFHFNEKRENFSEIVLGILNKYHYKNKADKCFIQCFDPFELIKIKYNLNSNLTLVQLLSENKYMNDPEGLNKIDFDYWCSREGLQNISSFADVIGPGKEQLVFWNETSKTLKPSQLYFDAKELGLFIHPYTFRVDSLPYFASSYQNLLDIYTQLEIDGLFTDFPDLT